MGKKIKPDKPETDGTRVASTILYGRIRRGVLNQGAFGQLLQVAARRVTNTETRMARGHLHLFRNRGSLIS